MLYFCLAQETFGIRRAFQLKKTKTVGLVRAGESLAFGLCCSGMLCIILVGCWLPFSREIRKLDVALAASCSAAA